MAHEEVVRRQGVPDSVGYMDGKLLVMVESVDGVDFSSERVAFDFYSSRKRVWFENGVVDAVVDLRAAQQPTAASIAENGPNGE